MTTLNKAHIQQHFDKAAHTYDAAAILQREIGDRLLERLDYIKINPKRVLDLGAGTGYMTKQLLKQYPKADIISLDIAMSMLKRTQQHGGWFRKPMLICADAEALPLQAQSVDLILSNLMLQWCNDLPSGFQEMMRVLKPGGMVLFSSFGPDTLKELRQSWASVDGYPHTSEFVDMHDVGDAMLQAGFAQPVMDMDMLTMTYDSVRQLVKDLKHIGANNSHTAQCKGLTGKQRWQAFEQAYQPFQYADGQYPASYEVIYGHAWKPETALKPEGVERFIPIKPIA